MVDFVTHWSSQLNWPARYFLQRLSISPDRFYSFRRRYGQPNQYNGAMPKNHWLLPIECEAIIEYAQSHPGIGYKRLTYMMLDNNIVAVSPSSTYRILDETQLLQLNIGHPSKKGTGFVQPTRPHEHWHTDITYVNIASTFYYLISVLDGYSRFLLAWALLPTMTETDIECVIEKAREKFPGEKPRIISDRGSQYSGHDFAQYVRLCQMTHWMTSPYYPQSNGKQERWHKSLKEESLRDQAPCSVEKGRRVIDDYVEQYNTVRLHSAIGYVTPQDKLLGNEKTIFKQRKEKLRIARKNRLIENQTLKS